jgi:hypothetical protein
VLAFADGAILLAGAMFFRLVAHHAYDGTGHGSLQGKLYLTMATRGKARVESMQQVYLHAGSMSPLRSTRQLRKSHSCPREREGGSAVHPFGRHFRNRRPFLTRVEVHASIDFLR